MNEMDLLQQNLPTTATNIDRHSDTELHFDLNGVHVWVTAMRGNWLRASFFKGYVHATTSFHGGILEFVAKA